MARWKGALLAAAVAVTMAAPRVEAGYLNAGDWLAAAPVPVTLAAFPVYSMVLEDAFGTYTPETRAEGSPFCYAPPVGGIGCGGRLPQATPAEGVFAGHFECHSAVGLCVGAYRITYTLPFEIIGFAGDLRYDFGWGSPPTLSLFDIQWEDHNNGAAYTGFYGDYFAPTNTISILWPPGTRNADDFSSFRLTNALVVLAPGVTVPEPSSLALLCAGLLAMAGTTRRRALTP